MYQEVTDKINTILMTGFTIDEILYKTPDFKTKAPKVYYDVGKVWSIGTFVFQIIYKVKKFKM